MFAAGRTANRASPAKHIVDRAAEVARRVGVQISERRILLAGLMVGERVVHDACCVTSGSRDVLAHVIQISAVVLAHDEKTGASAEYGRADA